MISSEEWEHKISGKDGGVAGLIIIFVLSAFFTVVTVDQLKDAPNKSRIAALFFGLIAVSSIYILVKLIIRYFFFKLYIGQKGFYFQSNPFNGRYYNYSEIKSCNEEIKTSYNSEISRNVNFYYFNFTDSNGKTVKFQLDKSLYENELNILKERINN